MEIENKNRSKKTDYKLQFAREKYKRVPLDISLNSYEIWKKYADIAGLPLNTFIKQAVQEKIDGIGRAENVADD